MFSLVWFKGIETCGKNAERIDNTLRNVENEMEMSDIEYSVNLKAINKFEQQNLNMSINAFVYEQNVYPSRISKYMDKTTVNSLLSSGESGNQHYCLIENMRWLLSSQTSNPNGTTYLCFRCLSPCHSEEPLQNITNISVRMKLSKQKCIKRVQSFHLIILLEFSLSVCAEFELTIKSIHTCKSNPEISNT